MVDDRSFRRWAEEGSEVDEPLRRLMQEASTEGVSPGAQARLEGRLAHLLGEVPSGGADTGPPPATPGPGGASSGLAGATLAGRALVLALGAAVVWGPADAPLRIAPKQVERTGLPEVEAPEPGPTQPEPGAVPDPEEWERADVAGAARAPEPSEVARPVRETTAPAPRPRTRARPPSADDAPSTLVEEARLLARAQAALDGSPADALTLAEEHAHSVRRGVLVEEREAIAVEALVDLGRVDEARRRADRLLARHPRSAYRTRLEAVLPP